MNRSNLYLQCLQGPRGVGNYDNPPAPFRELFLEGKIEQIELVQDFNIGGTYIRCFYKVNGTFYQNTPFNPHVLKPEFENEKWNSSGSFVKMNGNPNMISILDKMYDLVYAKSFIIAYRLKDEIKQ